MEQLSAQHEFDIRIFSGILDGIVTVEDMFPPDYGGDSELRNPVQPLFPSASALALRGVERCLEDSGSVLALM